MLRISQSFNILRFMRLGFVFGSFFAVIPKVNLWVFFSFHFGTIQFVTLNFFCLSSWFSTHCHLLISLFENFLSYASAGC